MSETKKVDWESIICYYSLLIFYLTITLGQDYVIFHDYTLVKRGDLIFNLIFVDTSILLVSFPTIHAYKERNQFLAMSYIVIQFFACLIFPIAFFWSHA